MSVVVSALGKSVRQQFADTMLSLGADDEQLVVVVGDISHGILQPFAKAFPGRYYNAGILEPTLMSMTAGMSAVGLRPVLHTIAPFLVERAFEQIKLDYCYHKVPGNIVTVGSAFDYANLGCTHHCYDDFALLKTLEATQITYPSSPIEFDALFRQAYRSDCVSYYRVPSHDHGVQFAAEDVRLGSAIRTHQGNDLTVVATGPQLSTAIALRDRFAARNVSIEVIYVHTIRPLDTERILDSVKKTRRVVVIEEHMRSGGLGDDILRTVYPVAGLQFLSASIPDRFVRGYGTYEDLCSSAGLCVDSVSARIDAEFTFAT
jgi:transketolase